MRLSSFMGMRLSLRLWILVFIARISGFLWAFASRNSGFAPWVSWILWISWLSIVWSVKWWIWVGRLPLIWIILLTLLFFQICVLSVINNFTSFINSLMSFIRAFTLVFFVNEQALQLGQNVFALILWIIQKRVDSRALLLLLDHLLFYIESLRIRMCLHLLALNTCFLRIHVEIFKGLLISHHLVVFIVL